MKGPRAENELLLQQLVQVSSFLRYTTGYSYLVSTLYVSSWFFVRPFMSYQERCHKLVRVLANDLRYSDKPEDVMTLLVHLQVIRVDTMVLLKVDVQWLSTSCRFYVVVEPTS